MGGVFLCVRWGGVDGGDRDERMLVIGVRVLG